MVRTDAAMTYFSRATTQAFLDEALPRCRQMGEVWLIWPEGMSLHAPAPGDARIVQRLESFDYDPGSAVLAGWRRSLPAGLAVRPIDRNLLERCEWRSDIEFYCGSIDNFLANDMGLCLMQGEEIIVEAYASSFGDTQAEIGAVTHAAYRGRGLAPIACAFLIEACERRGYHAYWSCDADNPASIRVARKLGFLREKTYQELEYGTL